MQQLSHGTLFNARRMRTRGNLQYSLCVFVCVCVCVCVCVAFAAFNSGLYDRMNLPVLLFASFSMFMKLSVGRYTFHGCFVVSGANLRFRIPLEVLLSAINMLGYK